MLFGATPALSLFEEMAALTNVMPAGYEPQHTSFKHGTAKHKQKYPVLGARQEIFLAVRIMKVYRLRIQPLVANQSREQFALLKYYLATADETAYKAWRVAIASRSIPNAHKTKTAST